MKHPLAFINESSRKPVFFALLAWTLVLFAVFQVLNTPLITSAAPAGIVSHQFAWTPEKTQAILSSWDERASLFAVFGLGLDYLFMLSYALTVALGALLAAGRQSGWLSRLGTWAAYGVFTATAFDSLENIGQAQQLLNGVVTAPMTHFVGVYAFFKFTLLLLGILYGLVGWVLLKKR
ncbi:MAG: hypothetical protein NTV38_11885 [Chloroflexi bacterium]|nr:hypothetical protein [Chloroflexota bacterium]